MARRTVHLRCNDKGEVMVCDPADDSGTYIQITGVPDDVSDTRVIARLASLAIWPWPKRPVDWGRVAAVPAGNLVRDL